MTLPVFTLPIPVPARYGLNKQESASTLDLAWATELENVVFDEVGLAASRKGTQKINKADNVLSDDIEQIFEYIDKQGNTAVIVSAKDKIYRVNGDDFDDVTGTVTATAGNWKFINFNGKCIGIQSGHPLIVMDSVSGDFDDVSTTGSYVPSSGGNEILASYGRVWAVSDNLLSYSDLLNETKWDSVYDLSIYWGTGGDIPVALAEFNGHIIVFGTQNILIFSVSDGDPDNLVKVESIVGIGCIARDSVQHVGDDIWFLSYNGVMSLSRVIQEKSLPMRDVSKNIRDYIVNRLPPYSATNNIKSVYSQKEGMYLLTLPNMREVFHLDTKALLPDGSARSSTFSCVWSAMCSLVTGDLYLAKGGNLCRYTGYRDSVESDGTGGSSYVYNYQSPWTAIHPEAENKLKILKRASITLYATNAQAVQFTWTKDFESELERADTSINPSSVQAQYGISRYGLDSYSASVDLEKATFPLALTGQYFQFGVQATVDGGKVALQSINVQAKIGRSTV